ncbi:MAG: guanylate kinase [Proteobacteria bacterium]|nr:guanylate kinase [Pseudomonadota bacterium]
MSRNTGKPLVVAAPSGAGKTSLVRALVESTSNVKVAISHTTRPIRPDETDKLDYFFIDESRFLMMIDNHEFLEWARVFGSLYGTSKKEADRIASSGSHLVLEIDWQGAARVRDEIPHAITIFILPPSLESLRERLQKRAQDDQQTVEQRMNAAIDEISHYMEFDYLIVNDDFDRALKEMSDVVNGKGEYLRQDRQNPELERLISDLGCAATE